MGAADLNFDSSSDGSLTGIAKLVATVDASNIGGSLANDASANGDFSAIGFDGLTIGTSSVAGIGGISTLKGQAQIADTLDAESVSGDALAGFGDDTSTITCFDSLTLNGASDGTILGTAKGTFTTTASTTGNADSDNAVARSAQSLFGINDLNLNLGGMGQINAIVNDTNFTDAHSVSGNATAISTIDAIGLSGGDMHIAGNASIMSTVGVDSRSE